MFFMSLLTIYEHTSWITHQAQVHDLAEKNITSGHTLLLEKLMLERY